LSRERLRRIEDKGKIEKPHKYHFARPVKDELTRHAQVLAAQQSLVGFQAVSLETVGGLLPGVLRLQAVLN
jgi:hypothetical protein